MKDRKFKTSPIAKLKKLLADIKFESPETKVVSKKELEETAEKARSTFGPRYAPQ